MTAELSLRREERRHRQWQPPEGTVLVCVVHCIRLCQCVQELFLLFLGEFLLCKVTKEGETGNGELGISRKLRQSNTVFIR